MLGLFLGLLFCSDGTYVCFYDYVALQYNWRSSIAIQPAQNFKTILAIWGSFVHPDEFMIVSSIYVENITQTLMGITLYLETDFANAATFAALILLINS